MTWIHRLKSIVFRSLAISLREKVRRHLADTLSRLDDRSLASLGVPRCRIPEHTREVARRVVGVPPVPARLRSWRIRRMMIRELSALDDRHLSAIGIEPGHISDAADAILSRGRHLRTTDQPLLLDGSTPDGGQVGA